MSTWCVHIVPSLESFMEGTHLATSSNEMSHEEKRRKREVPGAHTGVGSYNRDIQSIQGHPHRDALKIGEQIADISENRECRASLSSSRVTMTVEMSCTYVKQSACSNISIFSFDACSCYAPLYQR